MRIYEPILEDLALWEQTGHADDRMLELLGAENDTVQELERCKARIQKIQQRTLPEIGELYTPDPDTNNIYCILAVAEHYADSELKAVVYFDYHDPDCCIAQYAMLDDFVKRCYLVATSCDQIRGESHG